MVIGLQPPIFSPSDFFRLVIARLLPPAHLAERMAGDKEIGCTVLDLCKTAPRIYICQDFVGFPLIARNLASILRTLHSRQNSSYGAIWGIFSAFPNS